MPATTRAEKPGEDAATDRRREAVLKRLNRVEGQVRGIARMIESKRHCLDIITQVAAVRSALDSMAVELMRGHARACLVDAVDGRKRESAIDELLAVVEKFSR